MSMRYTEINGFCKSIIISHTNIGGEGKWLEENQKATMKRN